MNYLVLSPMGLSMFMVPSLGKRTEVQKIFFCVLNRKLNLVGKDLNMLPAYARMEVICDPWPIIKKFKPADLLIVCDDITLGPMCDHLQAEGYTVIGSSTLTDRLEDERQFATDVFSRIMSVPDSTEFHTFTDGFKWLKMKEKTERFVFKPNDSLVPKELTYVSKDIPDLLGAMETFKVDWKWTEDFQLQQFIDGYLVDFGGWFNGKDWVKDSHYIYFEQKPFLSGNFGPATGGEHAVVIYRKNEGVFYDIMKKLTPVLQKSGYRGQISINSMVSKDDKKPYFLELTPRFGYPSFPMDITSLEESGHTVHDLFTAIAEQKDPPLFTLTKPHVTLALSTPPYPHSKDAEEVKGLPLSWDKKWDLYFYPMDVMYDQKKQKMVLTGQDGLAAYVTCCDETLDGAISMVYDNYVPTFKIKNLQCRDDLGRDQKKNIKGLHELGLI